MVVRNYAFGTFIQDDWRATPRLTLTSGCATSTRRLSPRTTTSLPSSISNLGLVQVGTHGLSSPWKTDVFGPNLQPRFGAVYDVGGKGTTVVRAAFGIYSNWPVWQVFTNNASLINNPTAATYYSATGTTTQGTGSIGTATVSFPTGGGKISGTTFTPASPLLKWDVTGPVLPTGSLKCGDGLGTNPGNLRDRHDGSALRVCPTWMNGPSVSSAP